MKRPSERGASISPQRIRKWITEFGSYRYQVSEGKIDRWIEQWEDKDRDTAARLLDCVDFIGHAQISSVFRELLGALKGWDSRASKRSGRWRFVAYSRSAGESGDTMLQLFRLANGLDSKRYDGLFIHRSELLKEKLTAEDTVILIDDFSGTGTQVCDAWEGTFRELLPSEPRAVLMLIAAVKDAAQRIAQETDLSVSCGLLFADYDDLFSPQCRFFTSTEKGAILKYCRRADAKHPQGFGDCGLLVVFPHRCPNNTIPILHTNHEQWTGLFPRHG